MSLRRNHASIFREDWPAHRPDYRYGRTVGLYDSSLWTARGGWGGWEFHPSLSWLLWRRWTWALRSWASRQKFRCHVCGVQCDTAPASSGFWRSTAVCPEHCPEHDFEYDRDMRCRCCMTCGLPVDD